MRENVLGDFLCLNQDANFIIIVTAEADAVGISCRLICEYLFWENNEEISTGFCNDYRLESTYQRHRACCFTLCIPDKSV